MIMKIKDNHRDSNIITMVFIFLGVLSFMIVPLIAYLYRPFFSYVNGSDEQLYLSYQSVIGLVEYRGRVFSGKVVEYFHDIGVSGAVVNLIFDIVTPVALIILLAYVLKRLFGDLAALKYAWIVVFGSVLFNQSNPLLVGLISDFRYQETFWLSAFEGFSPFIRTPEPQLSLLLVAMFAAIFVRKNFFLFLLIPVPFLYDSVLLAYGFLVAIYFCCCLNPFVMKKSVEVLLINGVVITLLAIAIKVADIFGFFSIYSHLPTHYRHTHMPTMTIGLVFSILSFLVVYCFRKGREFSVLDYSAVSMIGLQIFLSNQNVISGISLFPQGLQSVGGTFGPAFMLFYFLKSISERFSIMEKILFGAFSIAIIYCINSSQGLDVENNRYRLGLSHNIEQEELEDIKQNPFNYVGATQFFKAYIGLAYPKQLTPPMAHQYFFPYYFNGCEKLVEVNQKAIVFIKQHLADEGFVPYKSFILDEISAFESSVDKFVAKPGGCDKYEIPNSPDFKVFPTGNDTLVYIRLYPLKVQRQGIDF